jgi:hypothetical protein
MEILNKNILKLLILVILEMTLLVSLLLVIHILTARAYPLTVGDVELDEPESGLAMKIRIPIELTVNLHIEIGLLVCLYLFLVTFGGLAMLEMYLKFRYEYNNKVLTTDPTRYVAG